MPIFLAVFFCLVFGFWVVSLSACLMAVSRIRIAFSRLAISLLSLVVSGSCLVLGLVMCLRLLVVGGFC